MHYTYAVLGAGRQGTAAAYDVALWGDAQRVVIERLGRLVANSAGGVGGNARVLRAGQVLVERLLRGGADAADRGADTGDNVRLC